MTEKRDFWVIIANQTVAEKVVFDEPVTVDEALVLYNNEEYSDILDSEVMYSETIEVERK